MGTPALVDGPEEDPPALAAFVALQPVMDIQDRTVFGYEALPRGPMSSDSTEFVRAALSAVQYTSPGLLFVPLAGSLLEDETFEPLASAEAIGAASPEIAWLISEATFLERPELVRRRVEQLHGWGFLVAIGDVAPGVLSRAPVGQLMPSFLILDPTFAEHVSTGGMLERAELAGLLAYYARLNAHVIARGIVDDAIADRMIGLGVRLGIGPHLGSPAVLDASTAEPGDEIVSPAWFRQQGVRVLSATGRVLDAPALFAELPSGGDAPVDAQSFACSLGEAARKMQAEHDQTKILQVTAQHLPLAVPADRFAIFEADWDRYRLAPACSPATICKDSTRWTSRWTGALPAGPSCGAIPTTARTPATTPRRCRSPDRTSRHPRSPSSSSRSSPATTGSARSTSGATGWPSSPTRTSSVAPCSVTSLPPPGATPSSTPRSSCAP